LGVGKEMVGSWYGIYTNQVQAVRLAERPRQAKQVPEKVFLPEN
jgi:hypothetical protein